MKIKVDLGQIPEAIKRLEEFRDSLEKKQQEFLRRLAEIGIAEAEARFNTATYDGINDVEVEEPVWVSDNKVKVRATGTTILFIEFGAGVSYSTPVHEKATEFGYERGGYGHHYGKRKGWYYRGDPGTNGQIPYNSVMAAKGLVYTIGNPANRCMWEASKKIRSEIINIAKEVFG